MSVLRFAVATLMRDWRSGELRLVAVALLIAITCVTTVAFFTDRALGAVESQASALLAADLAVESSYPLPETLGEQARTLGLATTTTLSFRSVVTLGDKLQLVEIKAVTPGYPLRGRLESAERPFAPPQAGPDIPEPGTVWTDARLIQILRVKTGTRLGIGDARLTIKRVLILEPDRGGDLFTIAPRVLMNMQDIPATRLVLPGSRVKHRLLVAGASQQVRSFQSWAEARLGGTVRLLTVRDARIELRETLDRAEQFLGLAALTSVLLAAIAIANSAARFAARHLDGCAIMRCLGASQRFILSVFAAEMLLLYAATSLLGCLLAYFAQKSLAVLLSGLAPGVLSPPSWHPVLIGNLTGLITLLGFAMPPLLALKNVPPLRVLRRDLGDTRRRGAGVYLASILAIAALTPWQSGQLRLTLYVLGGSLATVIGLAGVALGLVKALARLRSRVGIAWRYGLANTARRAGGTVTQVVALGLGIMVMLVLTLVRSDLLEGWRQHLPPRANNHFLVNIQAEELNPLKAFFGARGFETPSFYPMIRGRLIAINDQPLRPSDYRDPQTRRLAERDFNLSWASIPQSDNRILRGEWWPPDTQDVQQFSVENGIAESLGLRLGDTLSYQIADRTVRGRISSVRSVDWDTFHVNFFVVAPPGLLEGYAATYVSSFYLSAQHKSLLPELVEQFPSITVVDVSAIMGHVRNIMDRVAHAAEFVFLFTLVAGLVVLIAAIQSTHDERLHESAVLRTLGANNRQILQGLAAEFLSLGVLAGLLAAAAASGLAYLLAVHVFKVDYLFNLWLLPLGLLAGGLGVGITGLLGTRAVLSHPPLASLRRL